MILAIDIGNTHTVIGAIEHDTIVFTTRIHTDRKKTWAEYALVIDGILERNGLDAGKMEGSILSSVVPELKAVLQQTLLSLTGKAALTVGSGLKTGLNIRTDDPAQLGSDLVLAAVAAQAKYEKPIAIFDLGTATTLSVIDAHGCYIGGMIIPGMRLSVDALSAHTAQLPYVQLEGPHQFIGTNTVDCMQSGVIYGTAAMLDGLIDRLEEEMPIKPTVVITGGLMHMVLPYCKCRPHVHQDDNLLLEGLAILYEKNKGKQ